MRRGARLRRWGHRAWSTLRSVWVTLATLAFASLIPLGSFAGGAPTSREPWRLLASLALGTLLVARLASYLARGGAVKRIGRALLSSADGHADIKADLELGALLLVACYAAAQATGGPSSLLHPLVYALVAFLVTFHRLAVGLPLVGLALLLEVGLFRAAGTLATARLALAAHAGFIGFFALLHLIFLQAELLRQRREHRYRIASDLNRARDEARDFRLISAQLGAESRTRPRAEEEEKLARGAVETIHQALYYTLELLKKTLDLNTCALLWLDASGDKMTIKEQVSDADCITEDAFSADAGVVGTVVKNRVPLHLLDPKSGHLPYYSAPMAIAEVLALPVCEDSHLRGVLCADRLQGPQVRRFDAHDESLLAGAARHILRAVQSERIFTAVERAKYEHERLYHASALLNRALTPEQVYATAFAATHEICEFSFAAITHYDRDARRHKVVAVSGEIAEDLPGTTFGDNAGLVSMVVKNRHYLPAGGELRDKEMAIFSKRFKLKGVESLLVLPLICADEAIGTFVVASPRLRFFGKDKREMLGVIANQVAISAKNAEMYRAMEEMATTDGLTGLMNHRTFQERLADLIGRAERQGGRLALLITDIDHFKKVNDTYGHPVGDQVLQRVAAICKSQVRKIDVAARYGGEEFAIILDGTDLAGARLLAERIRSEVERQQFASVQGPFRCTISLGIAALPDDAREPKTLIAHADHALYEAKHHGRNQAVAWIDTRTPTRLQAVS